MHVSEFAYGMLTPFFAYMASCIGSLLGISCTARARVTEGSVRYGWLALAAISIGGTGIWVMHFIAMLGFTASGMTIRYDITVTLLSALLGVLSVGIGLVLLGTDPRNTGRLLGGGLFTGIGVSAMHYTGMAAMRMNGTMHYQPMVVLTSVLIGIAAATAALWFTLTAQRTLARLGAALLMGVAVCGMHYTGMASVTVSMDGGTATGGVDVSSFVVPLIAGAAAVTLALLIVVLVSASPEELAEEAAFQRVMSRDDGPRPDRVPSLEQPWNAAQRDRWIVERGTARDDEGVGGRHADR
jgi:NO-binding membrane sensor protein with MHYT domain